MNFECGIVLVAAGQGQRMGSVIPKQFLPLRGMPLYLWSLHYFQALPAVREIVVVVPAGYERRVIEETAQMGLSKVRSCVRGGELRQDSVETGVQALSGDCALVGVHDAARPFPPQNFDELLQAAAAAGAALFAFPVTDTLKRVAGESVEATVDRTSLWAAQTPQMFRRDLLTAALAHARKQKCTVTDDAAAVEAMGICPKIVVGSRWNIKVTTHEDWPIAEFLAQELERFFGQSIKNAPHSPR